MYRIVEQTLNDRERGYGNLKVKIDADALEHLVNVANGDARSLLNALELAVETTPPDETGIIYVTSSVAEESIQQRAVLYDKEGDAHFDTISAFIKSLRGSDPDAALYWLAKMVYAGEDPRFIFRRMLILTCEDVGLADPNAVVVVNSCAEAFDRVGMPEGRYHLAQATLYLANAPKSNSVMGFFDAIAAVEREKESEVPTHLKDGNRDKKGFGHGAGYLYPHAYRDHWIEQQYLPASLQGQVFYQPSQQGFEAKINTQVAQRREAQLAASLEAVGVAQVEVLTYGVTDKARDKWLQRTLSQVGQQLGEVRDRIFTLAAPQRHHLILDLNAGSGLLTWEALRQVPEGGVYACVRTTADANAIVEQATSLPELMRPVVLESALTQLPDILATQAADVKFDRIIGRNALLHESDKLTVIKLLASLLRDAGEITLAETVALHTQRLYRLLDKTKLDADLYDSASADLSVRLVAAEEAIYSNTSDPMLNWNAEDLWVMFESAGLVVEVKEERFNSQLHINSTLIERWFGMIGDRTTYAMYLSRLLSPPEVDAVKSLFNRYLLNQTVSWSSAIAFVHAAVMR